MVYCPFSVVAAPISECPRHALDEENPELLESNGTGHLSFT